MKKKNFRSWVCFIGIITIIFSCNPGEKKPGNTDMKDSTVGEKKEVSTSFSWTTDSELILGTLSAGLKIDGAKTNVDSAKITIRPKADFSAIEIDCSQGKLMLKTGWHGMGDYDKAYADWEGLAEEMGTRYSTNAAPGTMKVTEWANGKISGSFSVTVTEINAMEKPKQKLLEGEFHYLHDR